MPTLPIRMLVIATLLCARAAIPASPAADGPDITQIPSIDLPPSAYLSEEAKRALAEQPAIEPPTVYSKENIVEIRRVLDGFAIPLVAEAKKLFPGTISTTKIAGVPVTIVTPKGEITPPNQHRVLIELHAGALIMGAGYGIAESLAIASTGKFKVISVDYRLTPENTFPAISEDIANVYKALLKQYQAQQIGIFGSSIGGLLTAESLTWFQRHRLPTPGAVAMLGSGADARFDGDSRYTSPASGYDAKPNEQVVDFMLKSYFGNADLKDPLISPVWSKESLARFPPTLLLTSTRAHEMSSVVYTHQQLLAAGTSTDLRIWDGLPHCFYLLVPQVPESKEVFRVVSQFFERHLK